MTTDKQWMKRIKNIPLQIEAKDHRVYAAYLDVGAFGHVTIPSEIRKDAGIKIGDRVKIIVRKVAGAP